MGQEADWRPLGKPKRPAVPGPTQAFTRLAKAHAVSTGSDALFATALAGSLFFSIPVDEARTKVFAYLAGTMAPFSLLSPLIGPVMDRITGGRRWMIVVSLAMRSLFCVFLITNFDDLKIFLPLAFGILVMQKGYAVARSALVPTTVRTDEELVRANSKLQLLSGVMSFAGAVPGAIALKFIGPEATLTLASIAYAFGFFTSLRLPHAKVATRAVSRSERAELHTPSILLALGGMGLLRGIVGFLTILIAFSLRSGGHALWEYAVVGAGAAGGALAGAMLAPKLREVLREETILIAALLAVVVSAALSVFVLTGVLSPFLLALTVGISGAVGKLAFDSIVQRDAPEANRGRSFARFETRFQIMWVFGAAVAVIPMDLTIGFTLVLVVSGFAAFTYGVGLLAARQRSGYDPTPATAAATEVEARMAALKVAARGRLGGTWQSLRHRSGRPSDDDPPPPTPSEHPPATHEDLQGRPDEQVHNHIN